MDLFLFILIFLDPMESFDNLFVLILIFHDFLVHVRISNHFFGFISKFAGFSATHGNF